MSKLLTDDEIHDLILAVYGKPSMPAAQYFTEYFSIRLYQQAAQTLPPKYLTAGAANEPA